ncbi:MAG: hypothetical protein AAGC55_22620 [Myxococcota bacterium]
MTTLTLTLTMNKRSPKKPVTLWILCCLVALAAACGDDGDDGDTNTDGGDTDAFVFRSDPPSAYQRGDRFGMPFIGTFYIIDKDGYNADSPADDVTPVDGQSKWTGELITSMNVFNGALFDDLQALSLASCADFSSGSPDSSPCLSQEIIPGSTVADLIIPDTMTIDTTQSSVFPNGRHPDVPVTDRALAMAIVDLDAHGLDALASIPLNPTANDVEFLADFPYLAQPHQP